MWLSKKIQITAVKKKLSNLRFCRHSYCCNNNVGTSYTYVSHSTYLKSLPNTSSSSPKGRAYYSTESSNSGLKDKKILITVSYDNLNLAEVRKQILMDNKGKSGVYR